MKSLFTPCLAQVERALSALDLNQYGHLANKSYMLLACAPQVSIFHDLEVAFKISSDYKKLHTIGKYVTSVWVG